MVSIVSKAPGRYEYQNAVRRIHGSVLSCSSQTWLHTDTAMLPKRQPASASWNYHVSVEGMHDLGWNNVAVTYDMNRLQSIDSPTRFCVTLNATGGIDRRKVLARMP